jgi:uncharacterized membrane protein
MSHGALYLLTCLTALGAGVVAGILFAFSAFVMKALARLPPAQGILAMQSINVEAVTPAFMSVLFGTALASVVVAGSAVLSWDKPGARYLLLGGVLYVVGVIGVTAVFNVPRNSALAGLDPTRAEAAILWARYVSTWTAWNHVRMASALGAAAAYLLALRNNG